MNVIKTLELPASIFGEEGGALPQDDARLLQVVFAAVVLGVLATTAAGVFIDLFSGVTPDVVMPKEHVVTTAVIASLAYALIATSAKGLALFHVTLIAALVAFLFRVIAVRDHWPQVVYAASGAGPRAAA